ncbi:hypothetical protein Lesp01_43260 [Lentzea sp. NBRC 102530]|nr:hypothetical protein Lesp01_43260 [Lentzea sp. NBRC 102530]
MAAVGVAAALTTSAFAAPASADASIFIRHYETGSYLDASETRGVRLGECCSEFQVWEQIGTRIEQVRSGLCLDASVSQGVRLNACNGSAYQQWTWSSDAIVNRGAGMCLDGSASKGVRLNACNGSTYQIWTRKS